jgi:hypothetical protein
MTIRVTLPNATAHRTLSYLYEKHQGTQQNTFLDPAEVGPIYSGMVMAKTGPDIVALCDGATQVPHGLSCLDWNTVMDDRDDVGNWTVLWGGPDLLVFVDAPAFDTVQAYAVPTNGTRVPLYAGTGGAKGKVTSASPGAAARPIGELMQVVSATRIMVRCALPVAFIGGTQV